MRIAGRSLGVLARPDVASRRVSCALSRNGERGFSVENSPPTSLPSSSPPSTSASPSPDAASTPEPTSTSRLLWGDNPPVENDYPRRPIINTAARRRPYNPEAKMRLEMYRRQAMQQMRQRELDEERKNFQLDKSTLYQKGHPDTVQGVIKEAINIGYIVSLPTGREGFLPAQQLGCSGGVELLSRLYEIGEEIPVRVIETHYGGKDRVYVKP